MVTEIPQYSAPVCFSAKWKNNVYPLILNELRSFSPNPVSLAFLGIIHCARHSFAMNILNNGANVKTVASLLEHSGIKHTEKYTRAVYKLKEDAINSRLPELKLYHIR